MLNAMALGTQLRSAARRFFGQFQRTSGVAHLEDGTLMRDVMIIRCCHVNTLKKHAAEVDAWEHLGNASSLH